MTVIVPAIPTPVPQRTDPANFAARGDAMLTALPGVVTAQNAQNVENNALNAQVNSQAAVVQANQTASELAKSVALATANYKGLWSGLSGALNIPASVYHNGAFWALTSNLANVATAEPGLNAVWQPCGGIFPVMPALRPTLVFDPQNSQAVDPRITFTRASTATYFDAKGVLKTAASGVPRIAFHPTTGKCLGLMIENEARTNLALWSRDMSNAAWTKTFSTATLTATGIDGAANSATTITATGSTGRCSQVITSASAQRVFSAYVRRRTGAGIVQMSQDGSTWTPINVTNDYQRFELVTTSTDPTVGFRLTENGDAIDVDYAQAEVSTLYSAASSPILTTSATVTRASEVVSFGGATLAKAMSQLEGSFLAVFTSAAVRDSSGNSYPVDFGVSTSNSLRLRLASASIGLDFIVTDNGVTQVNTNEFLAAAGSEVKAAAGYALNNTIAAVGGAASVVDIACNYPLTVQPTTVQFGSASWMGYLARFVLWPKRLSDAAIVALTA